MRRLRELFLAARHLLRRLTGAVARAVQSVARGAAQAARRTATVAAATVDEARERHRERWSGDDQYRALLLAAVGALLATVLPPAVAAAVTTGIGVTGLLDTPAGERSAPTRQAGRYGYQGRYDPPTEQRPGVPLWERGYGLDD